jgi:hypothetical protein
MSTNIWARNGGVYLGFACSNTEGLPEDCQARPIQYVGDRHILLCGHRLHVLDKGKRRLAEQLAHMFAAKLSKRSPSTSFACGMS